MASSIENTIGARVTNAEYLSTYLKGFKNFAPSDPALSGPELADLIANIKAANTETAAAIQHYSNAIDARNKLFTEDVDSVRYVLSAIGATVRASFGKTSKEAGNIAEMIHNLRGKTFKKSTKTPTEESISQSERSFGSMTQNFSAMITTLESFGSKYTPSNSAISIPTLHIKLNLMGESNIAVAAAYGPLKEKRDDRFVLYQRVNILTQRIKDAIKSQYGLKSTEYNLVKGLKV